MPISCSDVNVRETVTLILTMVIRHARYGVMLSFHMWAFVGRGLGGGEVYGTGATCP